MSKRLHKYTLDEVRNIFSKENYILLSEEYKNNKQHLYYVCPNQHVNKIRLDAWGQGHRCPTCAGQTSPAYEFVKESFEKEGYVLLSISYINSRSKLDYICDKGHKHNITWDNWQQGYRCGYCSRNVSLTIEGIKIAFEKEDYKLLSQEYKNNKTKLNYVCSDGHNHYITWSDFNSGYRCPSCYYISITGENSHSWKGGISLQGYCPIWKDKAYKESILERDNNTCQNPYCYKKVTDLTIHHIDYDKKNCHPSNLITVCRSCNSKANIDRHWHTRWYKILMTKKYNYKY
ncbi:HNH endonuclease [bacterium]|nr:HNH endonuclease [bacterium]